MLLFSKPFVSMGSKDGFASSLANKLASWFWRGQKGYRSCGSQSTLSSMPLPRLRSSPLTSLLLESGMPVLRVKSKSPPTGIYPRSCPKSWSDSGTCTNPRRMLRPPGRVQMLGSSRSVHTSCPLSRAKCGPGKAKDCEPVKKICQKKRIGCKVCDGDDCKGKDEECYPEKPKCVHKVEKEEPVEEQVCPKSCVRGGKCIIAPVKKPPKMVYGSTECPPPKLVSPRICPRTAHNDFLDEEPICTERDLLKKKKDICHPPDLPGPPTDPVPLCPCPPPPKLHPGPCPCPAQMEDIKIKPSPPCPLKDKYPCCMPIYYCPPKRPCKRKLPCDQERKAKKKPS